jgi:hypothetical protein
VTIAAEREAMTETYTEILLPALTPEEVAAAEKEHERCK